MFLLLNGAGGGLVRECVRSFDVELTVVEWGEKVHSARLSFLVWGAFILLFMVRVCSGGEYAKGEEVGDGLRVGIGGRYGTWRDSQADFSSLA